MISKTITIIIYGATEILCINTRLRIPKAINNGQSRETGNNIGYTRQINNREYRRGNQQWAIQRN